jgi:hypothetical protein
MESREKNWDKDFFTFIGVIAVIAIIWVAFG